MRFDEDDGRDVKLTALEHQLNEQTEIFKYAFVGLFGIFIGYYSGSIQRSETVILAFGVIFAFAILLFLNRISIKHLQEELQ